LSIGVLTQNSWSTKQQPSGVTCCHDDTGPPSHFKSNNQVVSQESTDIQDWKSCIVTSTRNNNQNEEKIEKFKKQETSIPTSKSSTSRTESTKKSQASSSLIKPLTGIQHSSGPNDLENEVENLNAVHCWIPAVTKSSFSGNIFSKSNQTSTADDFLMFTSNFLSAVKLR